MTSESSPLLQTQSTPSTSKSARPPRTVTFNTVVSTSSHAKSSTSRPSQQLGPIPDTQFTSGSSQPVLSALNSKIRRRNSAGAPLTPQSIPGPKLGPQRTTRTAEKLKLLPNPEHEEDGVDQESGREVYSQFTRIKDPNARRDAARLGKEDRRKLPRVTAYCTASAYQMGDMMRFLRGRGKTKGANPKLFDECIYTPYNYGRSGAEKILDEEIQSQRRPSLNERPSLSGNGGRSYSDSALEIEGNNEQRRDDLIDLHTEAGDTTLDTSDDSMPNHNAEVLDSPRNTQPTSLDFDTEVHSPEVFLFNYGVVVIWGMTVQQEERFLKEIAKFETEKLGKDDVQTENFNFYYTREYQARIYNDFISLREKKNYMTKLAISHALAQSTKTSLYEDLVDNTIDTCKDIPSQIALTGKVNLTRKEINMQIGELFILRINIHLQGSVLDSPELMWAEPQLDPIYQAVRSYLEMDQRVELLTDRLDVIADLLAVLKDQLTHTHGEYLEWIVIILIAAEILVAAINIVVDLYAGVD